VRGGVLTTKEDLVKEAMEEPPVLKIPYENKFLNP
jgi:hypothetical protein